MCIRDSPKSAPIRPLASLGKKVVLCVLPLTPGLGLVGCSESRAAEPAIRFVDRASEAGIDVELVSGDPRRWYILEGNGSGAAWLDYDSDGDPDLFVGNGCDVEYLDDGAKLELVRSASSRLYRNDGDWKFVDVTDEVGARRQDFVNGVTTGDVDNDGDPDLYLACFGNDVFLRNDGGHFVDATAQAGLGQDDWGSAAVFLDADRDGALDLFVSNYVQFDLENPPDDGKRDIYGGVEISWGPFAENPHGYNPGAANRFYLGDGQGGFQEATEAAGLALEIPLCSYAAVATDVDGDGWVDLCIANDAQPSNLFRNKGDGTFSEEGELRGFSTGGDGNPTAAMGLAVADVDRDGDMDLLKTNFDGEPNSLHINNGAGHFTDRATRAGLGEPSFARLGWGAAFFDADCDGDDDLLVANGHVMPQSGRIGMSDWEMPSQFFTCDLSEGRPIFKDVTDGAGPGLALQTSARGLALADVDSDGDLDALITDLDRAPRLLENRARREGHWITVSLVGSTSNRDALGARVQVDAGSLSVVREMRTTDGLYSSHDPRLHFGLGAARSIDRITVSWPSGRETVHEGLDLDSFVTLREPAEDAGQ